MRILRTFFVAVLAFVSHAPTCAEDINDVLVRSQQRRLDEIAKPSTDTERVAKLRASFEKLRASVSSSVVVELRVVAGPVLAEALMGRILVVNQSLADVDEGERSFVMAHELGHIVHGHWPKLVALYKKHIPGEVHQAQTDAVAPVLGREASELSHEHELQADAFAVRALVALRLSSDSAMAALVRQGVQHDTATHPGTRKRVAQLRMLVAASQ
jgi:Zn-dependent protease with chaperone function